MLCNLGELLQMLLDRIGTDVKQPFAAKTMTPLAGEDAEFFQRFAREHQSARFCRPDGHEFLLEAQERVDGSLVAAENFLCGHAA